MNRALSRQALFSDVVDAFERHTKTVRIEDLKRWKNTLLRAQQALPTTDTYGRVYDRVQEARSLVSEVALELIRLTERLDQ